MPRRASWAAIMVPEKPPPTIATGTSRSDFIIGPVLRVRRAGFSRLDMLVNAVHRLARTFREPPRHSRVDNRGATSADQLCADLHRSGSVTGPAHSKRAWVLKEH